MTVSNKTMERIMRHYSNISPYDGFRIGGIGRVLNQIGLNQRKHHIIYKVSSGEFAIPMELTENVMKMQLIPKEEILEELSKLREEVAVTMKWIHIGTIEVVIKDNKRNLLIFTTNCGSEIQVLRREKAFNRIMPVNFYSKRGDFDAKLIHPKMQDKRKFDKALLSFRQQGLIKSDSFYEESEKKIINLKEALQEIKSLDISEESRLSLENVKRLIQRNFSENPLAWWDMNKIKATLKVKEECKYEYVRYKPIQMNMEDKKDMQGIIKEHINLGLIEPGVSAYCSSGFLIKMESESKKFTAFSTPQGQYIWNVIPMGLANAPQIFQREMDNLFKDYFESCIELQDHIVEKIHNFPDVLKDKKHLQSFLGVVNFAGIFIKDFANYRKDFQPLLKETESSKWKWEEIHTQRVRELNRFAVTYRSLPYHRTRMNWWSTQTPMTTDGQQCSCKRLL
ncbi:UNVERIFIED_CONTAM: putative enzymatic polyprotein [Sesamum latifolium]|uniref:Enzymatic polyprotein n=1 Tax=Sesamum latifolium TaxID=2727402 RepID=A0AAW2X2K0_9LAMI